MKGKKYLLNVGSGTLHLVNGCYYSTNIHLPNDNYKAYLTEDEAIRDNSKYMKHCKNCFKNH